MVHWVVLVVGSQDPQPPLFLVPLETHTLLMKQSPVRVVQAVLLLVMSQCWQPVTSFSLLA